MKFWCGPTGNTIRGHVLDVAVKPFVETMRFTLNDPLLYVKWNPKKCGGWGCWEIRRRPEFNSALDLCEWDGKIFFKVGPKEYDMVHHVLDCAFLNYDAIRKLKEMDTLYNHGGAGKYLENVERRKRDRQEREQQLIAAERKYMVRHYKNEINSFKEAIRDGTNPHAIAAYWDSVKEAD